MNYYIDLDSTLYDTPKLVDDILNDISEKINQNTNKNKNDILQELKAMFNRDKIYNVYELARYFASKYEIDEKVLINSISNIIENGEKYVFDDSINFLKRIKQKENTIYILTYVTKNDIEYQCAKIKGSKLANYVDNVIITSMPKFNLDLKYENGIFIDDNTKDLEGLINRNSKKNKKTWK